MRCMNGFTQEQWIIFQKSSTLSPRRLPLRFHSRTLVHRINCQLIRDMLFTLFHAPNAPVKFAPDVSCTSWIATDSRLSMVRKGMDMIGSWKRIHQAQKFGENMPLRRYGQSLFWVCSGVGLRAVGVHGWETLALLALGGLLLGLCTVILWGY